MTDTPVHRLPRQTTSSNPLANWQNDDLLIKEPAQKLVAASSPRAYRVLDWPMLRQEFEKHDGPAKSAKNKLNRHGITGAWLSAVGASLLALAPLFQASSLENGVLLGGCGFVLLGGLMGLWHLVGHRARPTWLLERLWAERLRQFYFQYLLNNLDAVVAAMGDEVSLERYQSRRDGALASFIGDLEKNLSARSPRDAVLWLVEDHNDDHAWGQSGWQANRVLPNTAMSDDHQELFECLWQGRIGIQGIYAQLNLKPQSASQGNLAHRIVLLANVATFVFIISLTLAGISVLLDSGYGRLPSDILIALSGVAAAWGLYFRLADQGMGYSLDAERYRLYVDQIGLVRQRFIAASDGVHDKIAALRLLEIFTYRELRQFLSVHLRSRFLG